jgi:hypothetical protein
MTICYLRSSLLTNKSLMSNRLETEAMLKSFLFIFLIKLIFEIVCISAMSILIGYLSNIVGLA